MAKVSSEPDTVVVSTLNSVPVANAGPDQTRYVGDTVTLDGNGDVTAKDDGAEPNKRRYAGVVGGDLEVRGEQIAMIFQQPISSLNPVWDVGRQIAEVLEIHRNMKQKAARDRALELLKMVGIPDPERRLRSYPHELSGGMAQRVMIAMALACEPDLLIADEPTTALDVTIQAQILDLLRDLQRDAGMSILLITHDLGVVAEMADHVAVMYASKIAEHADVNELFANPRHPYTLGLFKSKPKVGLAKGRPLTPIPGVVPNPLAFPPGCKFHPRCPYAEARCKSEEPALREIAPGHTAACHFAERMVVT
jgi:oligopeptide/dipeptide ABC transporter ATP-binding protein